MNGRATNLSTNSKAIVKNVPGNEYLNAYRILNTENLVWPISTYNIIPINGDPSQTDRGKIKNLGWELRNTYKSSM